MALMTVDDECSLMWTAKNQLVVFVLLY